MCYQNAVLYLHCSHVTLGLVHGCNEDDRICANYAGPTMHSYLLCCPACRGKRVHTTYDTRASLSSPQMCTLRDTIHSTFPTCARSTMRATQHHASQNQSNAYNAQSQSSISSGNPYGLSLGATYTLLQTNVFQPAAATTISSYPPGTTYIPSELRFPLTPCYHLCSYNMPETRPDTSGDTTLPCGCWTGKAPDQQTIQAALSVQYVGADKNFSTVWDVTGLGPIGCWKPGCGKVERDSANSYVGDVIEPAAAGPAATSQTQAEKERKFMQECRKWQKIEDWKDQEMNGDIGERGARLAADSRW